MKLDKILFASMFLVAAPGLALAQSTPMNEADCTSWMTKVDANTDGSLDTTEAKPFVDKMTTMNMAPTAAGVLSKEEFMRECQAGNFAGIPNQ
jgi:hypothetical protein